MKKIKLSALIEHDNNGYFAYCPELKGCHSQGNTLDEAISNLQEATELYLETLSSEELDTIGHKSIVSTTLELTCA